MYEQVPRPPQFKFNNFFNKHLLWLIFFSKVFCCVKTAGVDCCLKLVD